MIKQVSIIGILLLVLTSSYAQTEQNVINSNEPESEVHAAINPSDSNNIIVCAIKAQTDSFRLPIYYTKDFGASWQQSSFDPLPPSIANLFVNGSADPVLTYDKNGTAYLSWITTAYKSDSDRDTVYWGLYWVSSTDGGANWSFGGRDDIAYSQSNTIFDKQWLATDLSNSVYQNNVYAVFWQRGNGTGFIGFRKKDAGQNQFTSTSIDLSGPGYTYFRFPSVGVDKNGTVHVSFFATQNGSDYFLWHTYSTDGGTTFSAPSKISALTTSSHTPGNTGSRVLGIDRHRFYPCPYMTADRNSDNLYITWTAIGIDSQKTVGNDIYFTRSLDGGLTWDAAKILNDTTDSDSDEFYSSIFVDSTGDVSVSWYDKSADTSNLNTDYYVAFSSDSGQTFSRASATSTPTDFSTVGSMNNAFGIGEYTQIVASPCYLIPVWADGRLNNGNLDIYVSFIKKTHNGLTVHQTSTLNNRFNVSALYPNPVVQNEVKFDIELAQPTDISIQVLNLNGQIVANTSQQNLNKGTHTISTPINLAAGNYFLSITSKQGMAIKKFVVQ